MNPEMLANEVGESADTFIQLISKFNNVSLNTVPFTGSWTPGQVANHIIKATDGIPDEKTKNSDRSIDELVPAIKNVFLDFNVKYKSPEFVVPDAGPFDKNSTLADLERIKQKNIDIALTKDLSALCLGFSLPAFGYLTRYEWLKFIIFHTQRHIHQLQEMMETRNFTAETLRR
jgi:hypothetical protein